MTFRETSIDGKFRIKGYFDGTRRALIVRKTYSPYRPYSLIDLRFSMIIFATKEQAASRGKKIIPERCATIFLFVKNIIIVIYRVSNYHVTVVPPILSNGNKE